MNHYIATARCGDALGAYSNHAQLFIGFKNHTKNRHFALFRIIKKKYLKSLNLIKFLNMILFYNKEYTIQNSINLK